MTANNNNNVLIAMSGGVDSSVAAALMHNKGYNCTGVMLKLHSGFSSGQNSGCSSDKDAEDAKRIAKKLGIDFQIYNCEDSFEREVIRRFIFAYEHGCTPNPCIECNRYMKFGALFDKASELGIDHIATGHYARAEYDEKYGRTVLKKAVDESKDQSYVLYSLTKEQLSHVIFPLGIYTKGEIRDMAVSFGFDNAEKKDSQDICFISDGDYVGFIQRYTKKSYDSGCFIDSDNNILGQHKGIIRYTVGQHKKLGLVTPEPMYVKRIIPETNEILLVTDKELYCKTVAVNNMLWSAFDHPPKEFRAAAKLRYRHKAAPCTVYVTESGNVTLEFDTPQRAPAKGQSAVIYDGDILLGGGTIE